MDDPQRGRAGFLGDRRKECLAVGAVALLGLVLRVVYVMDMSASPLFDKPSLDTAYHVEWARAFARGEDYHPGPFFRAPLYLWFLGFTFKLFGEGLLLPRLIQCGFGAATVVLTYLVGKRAFDRKTGFCACVMAATYWVLIYFDGELLIPTLIVPLDMLAIWLTLGLADRARPRAAALAGLVWGLSAIARPNVLLFMPLVALWLIRRHRPEWRRGILPAAVFSAALLAPILPITAYNAIVEDDPVLISSQGGVNLWIGNNPDSNGRSAIVPGTRVGWWDGYHDAIALAQQEAGRELEASGVSRHYAGKAWDFILGNPGESVPLLLFKLRMFLTDWEISNNLPVRFMSHEFSPLMRFLPLGFGVLVSLGLFGLGAALGSADRRFPLWGFVVVYTASVVAFFVCARFRVPVLPPLMVFASHGAFWLIDRVRRGRHLPAAGWGVAIVVGVFASRAVPLGIDTSDADGWAKLAVAENEDGNSDVAVEYLERALEISPNDKFAHYALARVLDERGDLGGATEHCEAVLALDPSRLELVDLLLDLLFRQQRSAELEERALVAIAADGHVEIPRYWLGRLRFRQGTFPEAAQLFSDAAERDPFSFRAPFWLARTLAKLERPRQAIGAYDRAFGNYDRALPRWKVAIYEELVDLCLLVDDPAKARNVAQGFAASHPEHPKVRQVLARVGL